MRYTQKYLEENYEPEQLDEILGLVTKIAKPFLKGGWAATKFGTKAAVKTGKIAAPFIIGAGRDLLNRTLQSGLGSQAGDKTKRDIERGVGVLDKARQEIPGLATNRKYERKSGQGERQSTGEEDKASSFETSFKERRAKKK